MQTILVPGGAGFIGRCLVQQLIAEQNTCVVNLDKLTYTGNLESLTAILDDPLHFFIHEDIGGYELVSRLFHTYRPSAIVNFAAETHLDWSIDGPQEFLQTNLVGTAQLLI